MTLWLLWMAWSWAGPQEAPEGVEAGQEASTEAPLPSPRLDGEGRYVLWVRATSEGLEPAELTVPEGVAVRLMVHNGSPGVRRLSIPSLERSTDPLQPGAVEILDLVAPTGRHELMGEGFGLRGPAGVLLVGGEETARKRAR